LNGTSQTSNCRQNERDLLGFALCHGEIGWLEFVERVAVRHGFGVDAQNVLASLRHRDNKPSEPVCGEVQFTLRAFDQHSDISQTSTGIIERITNDLSGWVDDAEVHSRTRLGADFRGSGVPEGARRVERNLDAMNSRRHSGESVLALTIGNRPAIAVECNLRRRRRLCSRAVLNPHGTGDGCIVLMQVREGAVAEWTGARESSNVNEVTSSVELDIPRL